MQSFKQYLYEKLSSVLYHTTNAQAAASILGYNKFRLTPSIEGDIEDKIGNKHEYYMSFSRNKGSDFVKGMLHGRTPLVTFVLDGNLLSQKYSGKPVDYFAGAKMKNDEFEDRLFSNQPYIQPARQYIKEVHCFVPNGRLDNNTAVLRNNAEDVSVPMYFYSDPKAFMILNKAKAIKPQDEPATVAPEEKKELATAGGGRADYDSLVSILQKDPSSLDHEDKMALSYMSDEDSRRAMGQRILSYLKKNINSDYDNVVQYKEIMKNSGSKDVNDLLSKIYRAYK
jgi:hypothetical protein